MDVEQLKHLMRENRDTQSGLARMLGITPDKFNKVLKGKRRFTVEEATKLAGETDWYVTSLGTSSGAQGAGSSTNRELRERKGLPATVLTQLIRTGQGVVVGSLDGHARPATYFLTVPKD